MAICPHCHQHGVSAFAKWWSGSSSPASCSHCRGLSFVRTGESTRIALVCWALVLAACVVASLVGSVAALLVGLAGALVLYLRAWRGAELTPVSAEVATLARWYGWLFVVVVITVTAAVAYITRTH